MASIDRTGGFTKGGVGVNTTQPGKGNRSAKEEGEH